MVKLQIDFGRHYSFHLTAYKSFKVRRHADNNIVDQGTYVYCRHHLIEEEGVGEEDAYEYCSASQRMSGLFCLVKLFT